MNSLDLNFIAEALIRLSDLDRCWNDRRPRKDLSLDFPGAEKQIFYALARCPAHDRLLALECRTVYDNARLTRGQKKVLAMRLGGLTFEQIGQLRGMSRQAAQIVFLQAIKKLAHAMHVYPYAGLAEVYRTETTRGVH
jgi:hypothetical protein